MRAAIGLVFVFVVASCTFKTTPEVTGVLGTGSDSGIIVPGAGGAGGFVIRGGGGGMNAGLPCSNLQCQQTTCTGANCKVTKCTGDAKTTVSGVVYEPGGKIPLYNAAVYIPNMALSAVKDGVSCDLCDTSLSGSPVTQTTTNAHGEFTLENVPVGKDIPLVIQIGRWRREAKIPEVVACSPTMLTDRNLTRLPKNKSEGHIPKIALTTGGADALECLLRKIGIEDSEFTPETGDGRVNLFAGGTHMGVSTNPGVAGNANSPASAGTNKYADTLNGGAAFTQADPWWESVDNLKKYDIILHSCEGTVLNSTVNKSAAAVAAMKAYADMGGRLFASHLHYYWFAKGPTPWPTVATFSMQNNPASPFTSTVDTSFQKGADMADWLTYVGASTTPTKLDILGARITVTAVPGATQRWLYSTTPKSVQYMSFGTPVEMPAANQCGKVVFSDLHVSQGSGSAMDDDSDVTLPFPTGCRTTELSPQEKALLFMLFDLSACIIPGIG